MTIDVRDGKSKDYARAKRCCQAWDAERTGRGQAGWDVLFTRTDQGQPISGLGWQYDSTVFPFKMRLLHSLRPGPQHFMQIL